MTDITDAALARMLAYCTAAESGPEDLATLLAFWRQARADLPALVAALREAREALGPFAAFYSALIAHEERGIYPPPDDREIARFLGEGGPLSLTVGDVRRIARIVESGSAGLPQHESADGVPD